MFGWGKAVPVVPAKVLAAEGPAFAATIDRVSGLLTTAVMRELNDQVDVYQQDPAVVAKQFLQAHGLVPRAPDRIPGPETSSAAARAESAGAALGGRERVDLDHLRRLRP